MEGIQPQEGSVDKAPKQRFLRSKFLMFSLIQGLGLLLFLLYVYLHFSAFQRSSQNSSVQSIKVQFTRCEDEKGFIINPTDNSSMKLENNSIVINCDGFYLISLKGYFSQKLSLALLYRQGQEPLFYSEVSSVNFLTVAWLAYKDKVFLNVTTDSTSCKDIQVNGGELILIHQNPGEYCAN